MPRKKTVEQTLMTTQTLARLLALSALLGALACDDSSQGSGNASNSANPDAGSNNSSPANNATNNTSNNQNNSNNANTNTPNNHDSDASEDASEDFVEPDFQDPDAPDADPCDDGERRCRGATQVEVCRDGLFVNEELCQNNEVCVNAACVRQQDCDPGDALGCASEEARLVCNPAGTAYEPVPCADGLRCLGGECSDRLCITGEQTCLDRENTQVCNEAGDGYVPGQRCPEGALCFDGACLSGCELSEKFPSYIGCKYWSADLDQYNDPFGDPSVVPHAVVLSNPGEREATVRISTQADNVVLNPDSITVAPGEVEVYTFPRLDVDGTGVTRKSFYLESDWPIVAYQFNPLNNEGVASNDASLLLPSESLGQEYIGVSWPTSPIPEQLGRPQYGYITVIATRPGVTDVTVTPSVNVVRGGNVPSLMAGEPYTFSLRQYQVLNLEADAGDPFRSTLDLTGTIISAGQPVAVFGGHEEAVVGEGCCAEHLEEQLFPISSWGQRYLAVQTESRGGAADVWRVIGGFDGTRVETMPPQPGAESFTLERGQFLQFESAQSFEILSTAPVQVAQYMKSQEATPDFIGDPSLIMGVPLERLRSDYTFLTPADYAENWITVARPVDARVTLDGQDLARASFSVFGSGEYEYAWIPVQEGAHRIEGDAPFMLILYGYSRAVSYACPGGLDLRLDD
jgi:hypothetical protein